MPNVLVEDLPENCQVTIIISELVDIDDPNPPEEKPEDQERITCGWLARRLQIEIVLVDTLAHSFNILLLLHHFVLIVAVTGNKEADNQEQGEWVT